MRTITQSYGMNAVEWVAYSQARDASPIHTAIRLGDAGALLGLLAADEDPDGLCTWSPLQQVSFHGDRPEMITYLLVAGADVNRQTYCGLTALHVAVNRGRVNCIAALLAAGASPSIRDYGRVPPVEDMSTVGVPGCRRILPMLLRAGSPDPRSNSNWLRNAYCPHNPESYRLLCRLLEKVAAAGSWAAYERAHRMQLARIFAPKLPRIPKYVVPTVVAFWAHTGWY